MNILVELECLHLFSPSWSPSNYLPMHLELVLPGSNTPVIVKDFDMPSCLRLLQIYMYVFRYVVPRRSELKMHFQKVVRNYSTRPKISCYNFPNFCFIFSTL